MWISKIKINNFRNYKEQEIMLEKNIHIQELKEKY